MSSSPNVEIPKLPKRHLSIRVPWNDSNWTGTVCQEPSKNIACLILPRIREERKDDLEEKISGKSWQELDPEQLPPCMAERGQFMAPYELTKTIVHPYARFGQAHQHFLPTPLRFPAFSAACIPYLWMLRESGPEIAEELDLGYQPELEQRADDLMGYKTYWIQDKHNQQVMLNAFFSAVRVEESLCLFYAKRVHLVDDTRPVLIGVGRVKHVAHGKDYDYVEPGKLKSVLWERMIQHPNFRIICGCDHLIIIQRRTIFIRIMVWDEIVPDTEESFVSKFCQCAELKATVKPGDP